MGSSKERLVSGIRATGHLHLGHFFGALRNWLDLQDQYDCYFGIMDWHGMTTQYKDPNSIKSWTYELMADLMAWGIDSKRSVVFVQSLVPEHLELFMFFAMLTPMGWLERVPTWKDAQQEAMQSDTYNLGRFSYPVLQAADIALYRGVVVPVGQDQVPHLELSREIIRRFNKLYNYDLIEPKALLTPQPMVPGLDGRKMSKSYGNTISLSEDESVLKKKLLQMPTDPARVRRHDPGEPTRCPVYNYHKLVSHADDLQWVEAGCRSAGIGCGDCKMRLFERLNERLEGPRKKKKELMADSQFLEHQIREGVSKAREEGERQLRKIKSHLGFNV
ncbi:MAG: tryptophan--tRNA ligase [Bdellovibrionaceae bacterium]|nr:tryptophan--tRNA ligase [Pseudobdellovibrionaceae bacterium]MDW8190762.1 tryptophan--tRNA ligase [Pseudobdellovibrionaceae bacterium]